MANHLYVEPEKLYIAHMLLNKAESLLKEAKRREREAISKKVLNTIKIDKIDTSRLFAESKSDNNEILELQDKQAYLNNNFVKKVSNNLYIPFETRKTRGVSDTSKFEDFFGEESLNKLATYTLLSKTDIYKIVGAKAKTPIDEVFTSFPSILRENAKVNRIASIGYKRNAIKWNDAYQFLKTDKTLEDDYNQINEYLLSNTTPTLLEINNLIKPIKTFVLTGETASFNLESKYFNPKLFTPTLKESFYIDSEKLKELIEDENESVYPFVKMKYKNISGDLAKTVSFFDDKTLIDEAGVKTQNSIVLYDFAESEQDIQNFLHSRPEYASKTLTYGEYLEDALSVNQKRKI